MEVNVAAQVIALRADVCDLRDQVMQKGRSYKEIMRFLQRIFACQDAL